MRATSFFAHSAARREALTKRREEPMTVFIQDTVSQSQGMRLCGLTSARCPLSKLEQNTETKTKRTMPTVFAACEGGGTTFVVAIAHDDPTNIVERAEFKTTSPAETIGKCCGAWAALPPTATHPVAATLRRARARQS